MGPALLGMCSAEALNPPGPHRAAGIPTASGLVPVRPGGRPGLDRRFAPVRRPLGCALWVAPLFGSRRSRRIKGLRGAGGVAVTV